MILVIVESPAKAKTINKYLGTEYKVLASMGHVRDLPAKSGSIDPENNLILVRGAVPGSSGGVVVLLPSVKEGKKVTS